MSETLHTNKLTLTELDDDLKARGINLIVHRTDFEYDSRAFVVDIHTTIHATHCGRIDSGVDSETEKMYNEAMKSIRNK